MTTTQRTAQKTTALREATQNRDAARTAFNTARIGTKAWRLAEEDLNFWQGKVAYIDAWKVA